MLRKIVQNLDTTFRTIIETVQKLDVCKHEFEEETTVRLRGGICN